MIITSYKEQKETQNGGETPHPRWCLMRQLCVGRQRQRWWEPSLPFTPPAVAARVTKAAGTFQWLKFKQQLKCMQGLHLVPSRSSRQTARMTWTVFPVPLGAAGGMGRLCGATVDWYSWNLPCSSPGLKNATSWKTLPEATP